MRMKLLCLGRWKDARNISILNYMVDGFTQAATEVAKDVKDEVGQMIEQGVQSVIGTKLTPQQLQQKELERQKKLAETRRIIAHYRKIEEEQRAVRQAKKHEEMQKKQEEGQKQRVQEIKKEQKKQLLPEEVRARAMAETKVGRGVGG